MNGLSSPLRDLTSRSPLRAGRLLVPILVALISSSRASAQDCPEEPPLQNFTGQGEVVCPCFAIGEEAGAVLTVPAEHLPIEILRVGIGWGSVFGGTPQQVEEAIHIYGAGLPNPGVPIFTLEGPQMTDGFINEFNLEPIPGDIVANTSPFTVTLEFANPNAGNPFAPSVVHDGNGCQPGKNVIFAIPGGWLDGCAAGVTGDWVFYAVYRRVDCQNAVDEELVVSSRTRMLERPSPNPFDLATRVTFNLAVEEQVEITVHDIAGRTVATLANRRFPAGRHGLSWNGEGAAGTRMAPGIYFLTMTAGGRRAHEKVVLRQ
jgi:FlgD Ig-like domain